MRNTTLCHIEKDGKYFLTLTGYFILHDKITRVNMDFTHDVCYEGLFYLDEALKSMKPSGLHKAFGDWETVYAALAELPQDVRKSWFAFDHYFSDSSFLTPIYKSSGLTLRQARCFI